MHLGIFLAFSPTAELKNQGLGRYIAYLIKGLLNNGTEITLAAPLWLKRSITLLLEDFGIKQDQIHFFTTDQIPVLLRLFFFLDHLFSLKIKPPKRVFYFRFNKLVHKLMAETVSTNSLILFVVLGILSLILFLPLMLVRAFGHLFWLLMRPFYKSKDQSLPRLYVKLKQRFHIFFLTRKLAEREKLRYIYRMMCDVEINRLVKKINRRQAIDLWFCPAAFWPEFNQIKGLKVTCVPDLVPIEFPVAFSQFRGINEVYANCTKTIADGELFIAYDEYIKKNLLVKRFGKTKDNIFVIPNGANLMNEHINIQGTFDAHYATEKFARSQIEAHRNIFFQGDLYLKNFDFSTVRYLFYASQMRPSKNILTLLKAYEFILRKKHRYVKLFLTCEFDDDHVLEFIRSKRLQYDVVSFVNVPAQTLAALYRCAEVVINPTLCEGGFPFTFVEGASVGTPSIMSRIAQTEALVKRFNLRDEMLFDPYNWQELAEKMIWALDHKEELSLKQKPMFEYFKKRTWDVVAQEYLTVFQQLINQKSGSA